MDKTEPKKSEPVATVLRIKRRLNQDHLEVLLVGEEKQKRIKVESATVYKFVSSQEFKDSYRKVYESLQRKPLKAQPKTLEEQKQVLSARKLKSAQETRFKIASERRMIEMEQSGFHLVDIQREEDEIDDLTNYMVDTYLENQKEQSFVYDYYVPDHSLQLSQALDYRAGTLDMKEEQEFLDDEVTESDVGSSSDSNAEDYYKNDYPDEDEFDEDESNINPHYSEPDSSRQSSSSSDY